MSRAHRALTVVSLTFSIMAVPLGGGALASEHATPAPVSDRQVQTSTLVSTTPARAARSPFVVSDEMLTGTPSFSRAPVADSRQWGRHRGYGRHGGRNGGAQAAIIIGAAAAIAGGALLVYANRPECGDFRDSSGCGYGSKVIGGSLLAGGAVAMAVGAATWR